MSSHTGICLIIAKDTVFLIGHLRDSFSSVRSQILLPWVALAVQSLRLLTSIIQRKMCSEDCSVLAIVNSGPHLLFHVLLSRAGWLSCVLLVVLLLSFLFLYVLDLGQGFVERCPTCSAILLLSHKTDEGKKGNEGQESSLYLTHLCSASGEFCGITSAGKVCKHSS